MNMVRFGVGKWLELIMCRFELYVVELILVAILSDFRFGLSLNGDVCTFRLRLSFRMDLEFNLSFRMNL